MVEQDAAAAQQEALVDEDEVRIRARLKAAQDAGLPDLIEAEEKHLAAIGRLSKSDEKEGDAAEKEREEAEKKREEAEKERAAAERKAAEPEQKAAPQGRTAQPHVTTQAGTSATKKE